MLFNKKRNIYVVFFIVLLLSLGCTQSEKPVDAKQSLNDKILAAGEIDCAYIVYPPAVLKDPNTGELSGVFVDALEKAGDNLDLKINWTEEVGWGTMIEGLETNRYDLVVCQIWPSATRAKLVDFSNPLYYSAIGVFVSNKDNRFNNDIGVINSDKFVITTVDGEMSDIIANTTFPRARKLALTQMTDVSQLMLNIASGKADVTFLDLPPAMRYIKNNPGKVKNIATDHPIRVFPSCMMFKKGEVGFESTLNRSLEELVNSGYVDMLIDKYEEIPGSVYKVDYPYRSPAE